MKNKQLETGYNISKNLGFLTLGVTALMLGLSESPQEKIKTMTEIAPLIAGTFATSAIGMSIFKVTDVIKNRLSPKI